ncbi:hypothetical protein Tco_1092073 [Tanacetum coccineum]|uniref:Uncharacterized protein n=1 Tax=Tanacetum coccineum TaxID=301880 RepID=A0ABQ5IA69_9ASTR
MTEDPNYNCLKKKLREIRDMRSVEEILGGNATTRKTQRNLLKKQYEKYTAPSSDMLDQTFDRLQKFMSQLELLDEKLSQEDVNQKLLRSLSPVVWRNKVDLDIMSMDDLYNTSQGSRNQKLKGCPAQCTLPTEGMRSIISTVTISLEGFLPSILLLVMIIVAIVIVAVILARLK